MSKLYLSEEGRVIPSLCEELTAYRRARKVLHLPPTAGPGMLYLLARPYQGGRFPLRLAVNGVELAPILPLSAEEQSALCDVYLWHSVSLDGRLLRPGPNQFEFWTDATAMNAWALAIEAGHAQPGSFVSDDSGRTWRNERMAYLNVLRGEYAVRVRLPEGEDDPPPVMVWEDAANPRLESLRRLMPAEALKGRTRMRQVRALTTWLSTSWQHTNSSFTSQYAPWDAETILAWGAARVGHEGRLPCVMCVHYGVAFVSCCQAINIPARCAVFMDALHGADGHFAAEVWFDECNKWVMVDANTDAIMWQDGVPMSVTEIQAAGSDLARYVEWGPGKEYQVANPVIADWLRNNMLKGVCYRRRGIWPRADFLSHPELSPPAHGWPAYCETGLVWEKRDLAGGLGMFPYFGDPEYFDAAPAGLDA
jgi:hypothetical protein